MFQTEHFFGTVSQETRRELTRAARLMAAQWRWLLFETLNRTLWDQHLLLKRRFKPLLKGLGIQLPRGDGFYILRHGNATLMSSFGAPQKLRQERLGHTDGSPVTESVYTHVISEDGKRVAAQLGRAVWGALDAIGPAGRGWTQKRKRLRSGVS